MQQRMAVLTQVFGYGGNQALKRGFQALGVGTRPKNAGYVNSRGESTGCGIFPHMIRRVTSWGMPSGHAQTTAFAITLIATEIYRLPGTSLQKHAKAAVLMSVLFLVMYERVAVRCHTLPQVLLGAVLGVSTAGVTHYACARLCARW